MTFRVAIIIFILSAVSFFNCEESLKVISDEENDVKELKHKSAKIVGGQILDIEGAPYLAQLRYQGFATCGGSIISSQWTISGAHCLVDGKANASLYDIRTGSSRKSRGGKITKIELMIPHEKFNTSKLLDFDIMLIKLAKKIMFTVRQRPIKLASANKLIPDFTEVMACGFGDTKNTMESNEFLRAVIVQTVNKHECSAVYNNLSENMICAAVSEGGKDICQVKYFSQLSSQFLHNFTFFRETQVWR